MSLYSFCLSFRTPTNVWVHLLVPCQVAECPSLGLLWSIWSWLWLWPSASQPPGDSLDPKKQKKFLFWSTSYRSDLEEGISNKTKHLCLRGILSQVALRVLNRFKDSKFACIYYALWLLFQQWRLIPYLAAAYVFEHFSKSLFMNFVEFQIGQMMKDKSERQVSVHGLNVCASTY